MVDLALNDGEDEETEFPAPTVESDETSGSEPQKERFYERFDSFSRFLHVLVIISFLSLAMTGMTIKFSGVSIFQTLSRLLGGTEVTGFIHRVAAIITFVYFILHVGYVIRKKRRLGLSMKRLLTGENTLAVRKTDLIEFGQTMKWFMGLGPRPNYGRWTYWEKFDYFAVFWGILIIGASGLLLWFPEFFTGLGIPGSFINVATIIHSDEALLATGFIFTVHFFNTHFRPDKFPMDPVIFTGCVSVEELKSDRPRHYEYLVKTGKLNESLTDPPSPVFERWARVFGFTALTIGFVTILMIIYTVFIYK